MTISYTCLSNVCTFQASRYLAGCFYTDPSNFFELVTTDSTATSANTDKNVTTTLQGAISAGSHSQWLVLVRPQGTMEVCFMQLSAF